MTITNAKKYILANWFDGDEDVKAVVGGNEETLVMRTVVQALECLEKIEKAKVEKDTYTLALEYKDSIHHPLSFTEQFAVETEAAIIGLKCSQLLPYNNLNEEVTIV